MTKVTLSARDLSTLPKAIERAKEITSKNQKNDEYKQAKIFLTFSTKINSENGLARSERDYMRDYIQKYRIDERLAKKQEREKEKSEISPQKLRKIKNNSKFNIGGVVMSAFENDIYKGKSTQDPQRVEKFLWDMILADTFLEMITCPYTLHEPKPTFSYNTEFTKDGQVEICISFRAYPTDFIHALDIPNFLSNQILRTVVIRFSDGKFVESLFIIGGRVAGGEEYWDYVRKIEHGLAAVFLDFMQQNGRIEYNPASRQVIKWGGMARNYDNDPFVAVLPIPSE